jgi:hypothetical protein
MRYLFKEVRRHLFTLNPQERPALDQTETVTVSIQLTTHGVFYSCKRPYGSHATAYALVVLVYTQIATSTWSRSNIKRKLEGSANAILSTIIPT